MIERAAWGRSQPEVGGDLSELKGFKSCSCLFSTLPSNSLWLSHLHVNQASSAFIREILTGQHKSLLGKELMERNNSDPPPSALSKVLNPFIYMKYIIYRFKKLCLC